MKCFEKLLMPEFGSLLYLNVKINKKILRSVLKIYVANLYSLKILLPISKVLSLLLYFKNFIILFTGYVPSASIVKQKSYLAFFIPFLIEYP